MNTHHYRTERRSFRHQPHNYGRPSTYFITINTKDGRPWFDDPIARSIADSCWLAIPEHFPYVELDIWVLMPNHLHGIIRFVDNVPWKLFQGEEGRWNGRNIFGLPDALRPRTKRNPFSQLSIVSPQRRTLPVVIRSFKGAVTKECHRAGFTDFAWQGRYYEHVVRDQPELKAIRRYVIANPVRWRKANRSGIWMRAMNGASEMR